MDLLGVEQPTMAATLGRMARDGLIRRSPDARDGRPQRIWLTTKSQDLREAAIAEALAVNECATSVLDDVETRTFVSMTTRIIAALETRG